MNIACIGGGPAGLYFGLLMKKAVPRNRIRVIERNRPYDTFGWGVVFSDATLENLREADRETHDEIVASFAHWDDIEIYFKGHAMRSGGHGFSGIARKRLLNILQRRAEDAGVELRIRASKRTISCRIAMRSARRGGRNKQPNPHGARRSLSTGSRYAQMPLRVAGHDAAARCLHLHFRTDRARLVYRPRLPFRQRDAAR